MRRRMVGVSVVALFVCATAVLVAQTLQQRAESAHVGFVRPYAGAEGMGGSGNADTANHSPAGTGGASAPSSEPEKSTSAPGTALHPSAAPANPNASVEERFLAPTEPEYTEVGRGDIPNGGGKWRLYERRKGDTFCLQMTAFVYDPAPGLPAKTSAATGCSYPSPMGSTGNDLFRHGMLWFGAVTPEATRLVGRAPNGEEAEGSLLDLTVSSQKAFVVLLPNVGGNHELVGLDASGREVARRQPHTSGVYGEVKE